MSALPPSFLSFPLLSLNVHDTAHNFSKPVLCFSNALLTLVLYPLEHLRVRFRFSLPRINHVSLFHNDDDDTKDHPLSLQHAPTVERCEKDANSPTLFSFENAPNPPVYFLAVIPSEENLWLSIMFEAAPSSADVVDLFYFPSFVTNDRYFSIAPCERTYLPTPPLMFDLLLSIAGYIVQNDSMVVAWEGAYPAQEEFVKKRG